MSVKVSVAVDEARTRRSLKTKEVVKTAGLFLKQRVTLATEWLKSEIINNISDPVIKATGTVTGRSRRGEFPKVDTTMLLKSIFSGVEETSLGSWDGYVGTPLDYGLELEQDMDRSYLERTFRENSSRVSDILEGR